MLMSFQNENDEPLSFNGWMIKMNEDNKGTNFHGDYTIKWDV